MKKSFLILLLFLTSCSMNRTVINHIFTYDRPVGIYGEPFFNPRNTYIDNMDTTYMSKDLTAYYEMKSNGGWSSAEVVTNETDDGYYSDVYKTSVKAGDGYLKINRYAMQYIENNAGVKTTAYVYKGVPVNTPCQYRKLIGLTAKNIHKIYFEKQDSILNIIIN